MGKYFSVSVSRYGAAAIRVPEIIERTPKQSPAFHSLPLIKCRTSQLAKPQGIDHDEPVLALRAGRSAARSGTTNSLRIV
jgi:hypothetical protein